MPQFIDPRFPDVNAFEDQERMFLDGRRRWMKIKNSKLFNLFKHSFLNPYHFGVKKIIADTPEQEQEIARQKGLGQYIDKNGVRCLVNFDGTPQEEFEKTGKVLRKTGDVSNLIPRNKEGKLDLYAEDPIVVSVVPLEGISFTGHVGMQYKDRVMNRVIAMSIEPLYPRYKQLSDYYFIYPSKLGVSPEKLIREFDKHIIKHGDEPYNIVNNNCAKNMADLLQKVGVKDINFLGPDKIGLTYPTPGNNPFGFGIEDWCMRHGVPARLSEVAALDLDKYHKIPDLDKREEKFAAIRKRYNHYKEYLLGKKTESKLADLRKKVAHKTDELLGTNLEQRKLPLFAKLAEKKISDKVLGKEKE